MRTHRPADDGASQAAALARLAGQVDRLTAGLAALNALRDDVDTHTRTLRDLTDLLRRLTPVRTSTSTATADDDGGSFVAEWLTVTDATAAVLWLDRLHIWIGDVYARYEPLPVCWPWHPEVVAELLTCQQVWTAALVEGAPPDWLAAWHDRWRPGTATRVKKAMAACVRQEPLHIAGSTRWNADPAVLDELAHWWATTHGANPAPGLIPA